MQTKFGKVFQYQISNSELYRKANKFDIMKLQALGREKEGGFQFDQFEGKFQGMHFPDPIIVLVAVG